MPSPSGIANPAASIQATSTRPAPGTTVVVLGKVTRVSPILVCDLRGRALLRRERECGRKRSGRGVSGEAFPTPVLPRMRS